MLKNLSYTVFAISLFISGSPATLFAKHLNGCDLNGDNKPDAVVLERNISIKSVAIAGGYFKLDERSKDLSCQDVDLDGADELIAYNHRRMVVYKASLQNRALSAVCRATRYLNAGEIWKAIASGHINDARRFSTSFITKRGTTAPRFNCLYAYDSRGKLIHRLGRYFPTGTAYSSRFYGGHGCGDRKSARSIASVAKINTGKTTIYITSGTGNCAVIPNPARCYNSSGC